MRKVLYIGIILSLFVACESDDDDAMPDNFTDFGYRYYPLRLGQEHIFQVDSIVYNDFTGTIDTSGHQRREYVQEMYIEMGGRVGYIVSVSERLNDSSQWVQRKVIYRLRTEMRSEELNDNLRSVPMVFPVAENKTWNTNALNVEDEIEYTFSDVHLPLSLNNTLYDSTLVILQRNQINLIEQMISSETYAAGVGLISRTDKDVRTAIDGTIESGYEATISLISFQEGN